jgi:CBS domain-containing membrane protein
MRIEEIMSRNVETVALRDSVATARERMAFHRIHHLVVLDGKWVTGVVSSRDLKGAAADDCMENVMASMPVVIGPNETLRQAANLLRGHTIGCLPVVEKNKLIGIITITDLLTLIGKGAERPVEMGKRWTLKHRGPRTEKRRIGGGR